MLSTKPVAPSASSFVSQSVAEESTEEYPIASMVYEFVATSEFEISLEGEKLLSLI